MSVFSFSKTKKVWGLSRSITMHMIEWWIEQAGPTPYLLQIRESYDHGYNHADLADISDEDKAELRNLVQAMLRDGYESSLQLDTASTLRIRESIAELEHLLNADLEGTPFHSPEDR